MNDQRPCTYDVFISYSSQDRPWVRQELLPRLEAQGLRACIDYRDFAVGAPIITEIERALLNSRKTLLVLSPGYMQSTWAEFENLVLQTLDPSNQSQRLVPLRKEVCEIPLRIRYLVYVDFAAPDDLDLEWERLLNALGATEAVSGETPPHTGSNASQCCRHVLRRTNFAIIDTSYAVGSKPGICLDNRPDSPPAGRKLPDLVHETLARRANVS